MPSQVSIPLDLCVPLVLALGSGRSRLSGEEGGEGGVVDVVGEVQPSDCIAGRSM